MVIYNNNSKHFIGSIVYKFEGTISSTRVIIDGQQRLTTLYLLCKAIYDLVEDDECFKWRLEDVLKNGSGENTLVPIKTDNEVYSNLLENNHDLIKPGTSRIHKNDSMDQLFLIMDIQILNYMKQKNYSNQKGEN